MKALSVLLLLLIGAFVYRPGLTGGFAFDDYNNILQNSDLQVQDVSLGTLVRASTSSNAGPLARPAAMLSFALNYAAGGVNPYGYKLVNLLIHLLNTLFLYAVVRALASSAVLKRYACTPDRAHWLAMSVAAIWMLHPLNLSTVLYVVQRMNSLAALFTLLGLLCYAYGRGRMIEGRGSLLAPLLGVSLCTAMAALAKENGLLLPIYVAVLELTLFRFEAKEPHRKILIGLTLAAFVVPLLATGLYLLSHPDWLAEHYKLRSFTVGERLLTESRVLWFYAAMLLLPQTRLLGIYQDDFPVSTDWLHPITTLPATLGIVCAFIGAVVALRRMPLLSFAVLWFLAGHVLESSILPLELVHEHRNYLPSVGPILAVAAMLFHPALAISTHRKLLATASIWLLLIAIVTAERALQWSDPLTLAVIEVDHHPRSYRARYDLGRVYYQLYQSTGDETQYAQAVKQISTAIDLDAAALQPLFALIHITSAHHDTPDPRWLALIEDRLTHQPFHPSAVASFEELVGCQTRGECKLAPDTVLELFGKALANAAVDRLTESQLLTQLSSFYANNADLEAAERVARDVVELDPEEFTYRLNLIKILLAAGDARGALAEVERARAANARSILPGVTALRAIRLDELADAARVAER